MVASVFDRMAYVLFMHSPFAISATYTPTQGNAKSVRVIASNPKPAEWMAYQSHASVTPYLFDVRLQEIVSPQEGDQLTVGNDNYVVRSVELDEAHLIWRLNVDRL